MLINPLSDQAIIDQIDQALLCTSTHIKLRETDPEIILIIYFILTHYSWIVVSNIYHTSALSILTTVRWNACIQRVRCRGCLSFTHSD